VLEYGRTADIACNFGSISFFNGHETLHNEYAAVYLLCLDLEASQA
jgi:hypothetical protein